MSASQRARISIPDRIAIGYQIAIAQRYFGVGHAQSMTRTEATSTFWERLTSRMSEKNPELFPTAAAVTQKAAGKLIGKSQNAGFKWKHGILPERKHMVEIGVKLGVAVEWLETGRGPKFVPNPHDPLSVEIFRLVADSDELQRMEFLNFLQYTVAHTARNSAPTTRFPKRSAKA